MMTKEGLELSYHYLCTDLFDDVAWVLLHAANIKAIRSLATGRIHLSVDGERCCVCGHLEPEHVGIMSRSYRSSWRD